MALPTARSALSVLSHTRQNVHLHNAVASSSRWMSTSTPVLATTSPSPSSATRPPVISSSNKEVDELPVPLPSIKRFLSFPPLSPVKPTHGVRVASLHLQSYHPYNLDLYSQFCVHSASSMGIPTSLPAFLPKEKSLYTVLKSPFVKKKAQENFQRITHKRAITIYDTSKEIIDLYLRYIRQNGLPGVGIKAYVHEWVEFGFGAKEGKGIGAEQVDEARIQEAAQDLVKALSEGESQRVIEGEVKEQSSETKEGEVEPKSATVEKMEA